MTQSRRTRCARRPTADRHRKVGLVLLLLLGGCSESQESDRSPEPLNPYPIRLLAELPDEAHETLFETRFEATEDLAGWQLLSSAGELIEATGAPGQTIGARGLERGQDSLALVRLMVLPTGVPLRIVAGVTPSDDVEQDEQSAAVQCFPLGPIRDPGDLERILATGRVPLPGGDDADLRETLAYRLEALRGSRPGRYRPADRPGAEASIELVLGAAGRPQVRVVALLADPAVRAVRSLRISTSGGSRPPDQPYRAVLDGEARLVRTLEPGGKVRLTVDVDSSPARLGFGLARQPAPGSGETGPDRWGLLISAGGQTVLETNGDLARTEPGAAPFTDLLIELPPLPPAPGPLQLTWSNPGSGPLLLSQPMLRGAAIDRRPNLLLISLDTLRADRLSAYGYRRTTSPFLDRLAAGSIRVEQCKSVASHTLPSHVSMLTGLLPPQHQVLDLTRQLDGLATPFLPRILAESGYATAAYTGGGFVSAAFGFATGFDRFVMADPMHPDEGIGMESKRSPPQKVSVDDLAGWIEKHDGERWFAFLHTYAIHNYRAPREHVDRFDAGSQAIWRDDLHRRLDPRHWKVPGNEPTAADIALLGDLYDASIHYVDQELERLFARLEKQSLLDETIVIITSDHGEEFWEHQGLQHSLTLYEEQLRVPLIVRLPGQREGRVIDQLFSLADLTPTILDLLDLSPPSSGTSMATGSRASLLLGSDPSTDSSSPILSHLDQSDARVLALQEGRFKIIRGETGDQVRHPSRKEWELFDLSIDPTEQGDLSDADPVRLRELRRRLEQLERQLEEGATDRVARPLDESVLEQLRALGYAR